jgi:hypothetical protein
MPESGTSELAPHARLEQIASILARGVRRFKQSALRCHVAADKELSEFSPRGLEVSGDSRLSESRRIGS